MPGFGTCKPEVMDFTWPLFRVGNRNPENPKSWKPENGLAAHEVWEEDVYFDGQGHSVACPWQLLAARAGVPLSLAGTPRAAKGYPTALQEQGPHARIRNL